MSFSGLRKQFNKANQYLSETMGAAEPTKLDDDYNEMERRVDTTYDLVTSLIAGTHEYLQPNPATRAKMATMGALSKVRGTTKTSPYPQTEGLLADTMQKYGTALGNDSDLGKALIDASESYRQMADIKYQMEDNVKRNFLDPLAQLQQIDLKEVNHHRSKLKGRRLDYDCKKRKQTRDEELIQAEEKLEDSKRLAEQAMYNLLSNDVEQVSQLCALVDAQLDFHRQTTQVLERLRQQLNERVNEANSRPKTEHIIKPVLADRTPSTRSPVLSRGDMNSSGAGGGGNLVQPSIQSTYPNPNGGADWSNVSSSPAPMYPTTTTTTATPSSNSMQAPQYGGGQSTTMRMSYGVAGGGGGGGGVSPLNAHSTTSSTVQPSAPSLMPPPLPSTTTAGNKPTAKALYDFEAQNDGELDFKEGDLIDLIAQVDENWFEGSVRGAGGGGKSGLFPVSYVQVLVPL